MKRGLLFILPLLFTSLAFGQSAPLESDRPSQTTGTSVLDLKSYQIELGFNYVDDDDSFFSGPHTVFRTGIYENLELQVGWDGYTFDDDEFANDMSLGFKYYLSDQTDKLPAMGILATASLPTGSGEHNDVDPEVRFLWEWDLNEISSISGNIGLGAPTDSVTGDRFTQGIFTFMYSRELFKDTNGFVEYFSNINDGDGEDCAHSIQIGLKHLYSHDWQVDAFVGFGLNDQAEDVFGGIGISHSF